MKNIIFISTLTLWSMGKGQGGPAFTKTIKKYIDDGWNVFLISDEPQNAAYPDLDREHNIQIKPSFFKRYEHIRTFGVGLIFRILNHLSANAKFVRCAASLIKSLEGETLFYAYEIFGVKAAVKLAKRFKLPVVSRFQGTILSQYSSNAYYRLRKYPHFQALSEKTNLVIMTDDGTQGDRVLKELKNNSPMLFLKNGLDLMEKNVADMYSAFDRDAFRAKLGIMPEHTMLLTVSRLVPWKKVERALEGFAASKEENAYLVIVGDGESKSKLRSLAEKLGVADRVVFTGAVLHEEVYNYMMACDIFLSLYDLSNVGNPLLEAMTLGKCIVTLDVGDTAKIIKNRENGILLNYQTLSSLGDVISELTHNVDLRHSLGRGAASYSKANYYSWEKRMNIEIESITNLMRKATK